MPVVSNSNEFQLSWNNNQRPTSSGNAPLHLTTVLRQNTKLYFLHKDGALLDENVHCWHVAKNKVHYDEEECANSAQHWYHCHRHSALSLVLITLIQTLAQYTVTISQIADITTHEAFAEIDQSPRAIRRHVTTCVPLVWTVNDLCTMWKDNVMA